MVIHSRVSYDAQTFVVQGAQAFMAQAETYQYTFIMVFAKGMFREGARDGPVCFITVSSNITLAYVSVVKTHMRFHGFPILLS